MLHAQSFYEPIAHLQVDIQVIICVPRRLQVFVPFALKIDGQLSGGTAGHQVTSVFKIQERHGGIAAFPEQCDPLVGASKKDISRVFNAETLIVGFVAGLIGILATVLLCLPINAIIHALSGVEGVRASLPIVAAIVLVAISMLLTFIAGLIPSRLASKKDPVEALRSE